MTTIDRDTFNQYLERLLLGDSLTPEEEVAFQQKLDEDTQCRQEWEKVESFTEGFRAAYTEVTEKITPPKSRVLSRLEFESSRLKPSSPPKRSWRALLGIFLVSAVALLLVVYAGLATLYKIRQNQIRKWIKRDLNDLQNALHHYKNKHGQYPDHIQNLMKKKRLDPWGRTYRIFWTDKEKTKYLLYSVGKNGQNEYGQGDDLTLDDLSD